MPEPTEDNLIGTIHRAGPIVDRVQLCLDCGGVMLDYRGAQIMTGDQDGPAGWGMGSDVTYWGALERSNTAALGVHHPAIRCKAVPS